MDTNDLLRWYQSYFDLTGSNRAFVLFYRNESGWPQAAFYDSETYTRQDAEQKGRMPKYYSSIIPCRIESGAAVAI